MTRKSERELTRAIERLGSGDDDPQPVIGFRGPNGEIVDADGEPFESTASTIIVFPEEVTDKWEREVSDQ